MREGLTKSRELITEQMQELLREMKALPGTFILNRPRLRHYEISAEIRTLSKLRRKIDRGIKNAQAIK